MSIYHHADCINPETGLPSFPDKHFDLAIVDPPYGIGAGEMRMGKGKPDRWKRKLWDFAAPSQDYFSELFRVSVNQVIWGGNYFDLPKVGGWLFWDKERNKDISFGDGELAWTNFLSVVKKAPIQYDGFLGADDTRIHATQKPIALYRWLLKNYAKAGDLILDTHVGSASSLVAFEEMGFEYVGYELDADYYRDSTARLEAFRAQPKLFTGGEIFRATQGEQGTLFEL